MKKLRYVMVGGFLGAGKTTALARLARYYMSRGQKVGIVTNDQAADLVDTTSLRAQGFPVEEVAGACFCCRFDELVSKVGQLETSERPDVLLAEPVGSCTDLVATVVLPLKSLYGDRFALAPYAVLFKPSHGLRILKPNAGAASGFSPKAAYIFRKQLEEADAIVINRIDEMTPEGIAELVRLVSETYPGTPILKVSARTGQGFEALTELLDQEGSFGRRIFDIDYDTYAEGEAELGWLNASVRVASGRSFAIDDLLLDVIRRLQKSLQGSGEVAHLKAIALGDVSFGVANLVSSATQPELSMPSKSQGRALDLIVNARATVSPEDLEAKVRQCVAEACAGIGASGTFHTLQSFRPGRPQPTHRFAPAK
jgi:G3E family GTPase